MSRKRIIINDLTSIERMALRAFIDHGQLPKITVLRRLIELRLITRGPCFDLHEGVAEAVVEYERDARRRHILSPDDTLRALRARKDSPII